MMQLFISMCLIRRRHSIRFNIFTLSSPISVIIIISTTSIVNHMMRFLVLLCCNFKVLHVSYVRASHGTRQRRQSVVNVILSVRTRWEESLCVGALIYAVFCWSGNTNRQQHFTYVGLILLVKLNHILSTVPVS